MITVLYIMQIHNVQVARLLKFEENVEEIYKIIEKLIHLSILAVI
jgi:hypothetical protein